MQDIRRLLTNEPATFFLLYTWFIVEPGLHIIAACLTPMRGLVAAFIESRSTMSPVVGTKPCSRTAARNYTNGIEVEDKGYHNDFIRSRRRFQSAWKCRRTRSLLRTLELLPLLASRWRSYSGTPQELLSPGVSDWEILFEEI